ncbi:MULTISPECIES: hypothetical protein [unclassified Nonomuraea]|uniref:hypothetical protein n=1 Tax=unclassified Nonomuraea TaxID=2593643 RepID=UPI0033D870C0
MSESQFTRKIVDAEAEGDRTKLVHYLLTGEHGTVEMLLMKPPAEAFLWPETGGWHGAGVAYHAPFPFQDDQEPRQEPCEYVLGGRCFYDVTYSHPEDLTRAWWEAGRDDEMIWREAEDRYLAFFTARELLAKAFDDQECAE